ncbi:MAG TPA: hypothetical protein VN688_05210 [Gemmataceae bacterium]|nr:hypothetical protein [Gemmataceae bacterium]
MFMTRGVRRVWLLSLSAWAFLLAPHYVEADDRYFLIVFASQSHPKIPRLSHTFATIVRVTDAPLGCLNPRIEAYTISWLPQTMKVRPWRLHDEPGENFTLDTTLRWAYENHMHVSEWGPYEIEGDFFTRVYREYIKIENGQFRYKAIDPRQRGARTTDCIHAVSDIDRQHDRYEYPAIRSGDAVTRKFVRVMHQRGSLIVPSESMAWLESALGLDRYPIIHRHDP